MSVQMPSRYNSPDRTTLSGGRGGRTTECARIPMNATPDNRRPQGRQRPLIQQIPLAPSAVGSDGHRPWVVKDEQTERTDAVRA